MKLKGLFLGLFSPRRGVASGVPIQGPESWHRPHSRCVTMLLNGGCGKANNRLCAALAFDHRLRQDPGRLREDIKLLELFAQKKRASVIAVKLRRSVSAVPREEKS